MQNMVWKIVLIVAVVVLCFISMYPPSQKIRLGKDLRGGTSMIYHVNIPNDVGNKAGVLAQTVETLSGRINPTGVLDFSMQPMGLDRIEIVMPLPSDEVKSLKSKYEQDLAELLQAAQWKPEILDEALKANHAAEQLGAGNADRMTQLEAVQKAYNDLQTAKQSLEEAKGRGDAADAQSRLAQAVVDAQFEFDKQRDALHKSDLDRARVLRILNLPKTAEVKKDADGKAVLDDKGGKIALPSQRESAITGLKSEFPHLSAQIDKTLSSFDEYQSKRTTLDDPEDLMRLLRGAGVLEFHIAVQPGDSQGVNVQQMKEQLKERGPDNTDSTVARWYPINELKQWYETPQQLASLEADPESYLAARRLVGAKHEGVYYVLLYISRDKSMTHDAESQWTVESAGNTADQFGRPAVSFHLDPAGGVLMSRLTGPHVGHPMAIVLDGQVYSAPNLQSQISASGQITGSFSKNDINYLIRVLASGALQARLSSEPIAIDTLGPSIGQENLTRGLTACAWSVVAVAIFMLIYYFWAGFVANIAVACDAILIFGVMSMIDGTFTLPGLAGIALTLATAVDANILIYERIREELATHEVDLRGAIRLGYQRAFSTILDANVTNLIVCVALMETATTEVKGFALTLMIGILGTLFCALFITRVIYTLATDVFGMKRMPMLATTFPAVRRFLEPHLDWIGLRKYLIPLSASLVLISIVLIATRGTKMFDTEFRGGLSATMRTSIDPATHKARELKQIDVERRVRGIGQHAESMAPSETREVLRELRDAEVLTVGTTGLENGALTASAFQLKVAAAPRSSETALFKNAIVQAIVDEFGKELDIVQPLQFAGAGTDQHATYTFPVTDLTLDKVIKRPEYKLDTRAFMGGVALVVDDINPPATKDDLEHRIKRMREQPDFSDTAGRDSVVQGLQPADPADPTKGYKSAVILTTDPVYNYSKVDFESWDLHLAGREWNLVSSALTKPAALDQVSEFSSAVAATLRAKAGVAVTLSLLGILVYIWIRFGSLRYSAGAVIALVHDAAIGLGAVALSQYIGDTAFGKALLIQPFHIDLTVVAAVLTLMGYSLNDTIVVLDRIRENRGKLQIPTAETVNKSINQTFSRTTLTSLTIFICLIIMYVVGGTGIRAFTYVMLVGMFVGTYSSIAIAAPMVFKGHDPNIAPTPRTMTEVRKLKPQPVAT